MYRLILFFNLFLSVYSSFNFQEKWDVNKVIIQEVLETEIDDYATNKFVNEFMRIHKPNYNENNILETLVITKEQQHCTYFFKNNHEMYFLDNLERNYQNKYDKHNWYSYHKVFVPNHLNLQNCYDIFQHKFGSYIILSGSNKEDDGERVNNFIKRYHFYKMFDKIEYTDYSLINFVLFISSLVGLYYFMNKRQKQIRYMLKILKFLKERNTFPNNL